MPSDFIVPPNELGSEVVVTKDEIYRVNPHDHEFQVLDGMLRLDYDTGISIGFCDTKEDDWWVRGHIPGRPIFPGILMLEAAAQLSSYHAMTTLKENRFIGFGAIDNVKFRGLVQPGDRLHIIGKALTIKPRRCVFDTQGTVGDKLVFEARITGLRV